MINFSTEIVFGSKDNNESRQISQQLQTGLLRKIAAKIYTTNFEDAATEIIYHNRYQIASHLFPSAIVSHRTAFEGDVKLDGTLFLTYSHRRNLVLPGLTIQLIKNEFSKEGTSPYLKSLYISGYERTLLENLQASRQRNGARKTVDREAVEQRLEKFCRIQGEAELNRVRECAEMLAALIGMQSEYKQLDEMIGAILGTRSTKVLRTPSARARAQGLPYDTVRLERFMSLNAALRSTVLPVRKLTETSIILRNIAFFDAYFSNFIEGTEFDPEEAAAIVFNNRPLAYRHADSHDIIATYNIVSDSVEMCTLPDSPEIFEMLLKKRHSILLAAREKKHPGKFKEIANRAGNTEFVSPELVRGTLAKGFELYQLLDNPFARAAFMMFVVSEVHPFLDGNGRLARTMMNADLIAAGQCRILIPTVFREDYLLTLRRLTREGDAKPYIKMLARAQEFVAKINFDNFDKAIKILYASNAFAKHDEGVYLKMPV